MAPLFTSLTAALVFAMLQAAPAADPAAAARRFLDAFATDPDAVKGLVRADAQMAMGDIGGSFSRFIPLVKKARWLSTCRTATLHEKPLPADMGKDADAPPWMRGGAFTAFEGTYACVASDGRAATVAISLGLNGGRVVFLQLASCADPYLPAADCVPR